MMVRRLGRSGGLDRRSNRTLLNVLQSLMSWLDFLRRLRSVLGGGLVMTDYLLLNIMNGSFTPLGRVLTKQGGLLLLECLTRVRSWSLRLNRLLRAQTLPLELNHCLEEFEIFRIFIRLSRDHVLVFFKSRLRFGLLHSFEYALLLRLRSLRLVWSVAGDWALHILQDALSLSFTSLARTLRRFVNFLWLPLNSVSRRTWGHVETVIVNSMRSSRVDSVHQNRLWLLKHVLDPRVRRIVSFILVTLYSLLWKILR